MAQSDGNNGITKGHILYSKDEGRGWYHLRFFLCYKFDYIFILENQKP